MARRKPMDASIRRSSDPQVDGNFSGIPDDRWAFTTKSRYAQYGAAASLAAAARVLKGWDDALAKECLETAAKLYQEERANPTANTRPGGGPGGPGVGATPAGAPGASPGPGGPGGFGGAGQDWAAALELTIATNGAEPYKLRVSSARIPGPSRSTPPAASATRDLILSIHRTAIAWLASARCPPSIRATGW